MRRRGGEEGEEGVRVSLERSAASSARETGSSDWGGGTNDSIMIRVPDHTVTGHLSDITGPLAITSANPSGEPDSTHHDMVIR